MDFVLCSGKSELLRLKLLNIKHSLFMRHPVVSFNDKATLEPLMLREVRNTHQLLLSLLLVCSLSGQLCLGLLCSLSLSFQTFGLFSGPLPLLLQLQGLTSLLLQFCKTTHTSLLLYLAPKTFLPLSFSGIRDTNSTFLSFHGLLFDLSQSIHQLLLLSLYLLLLFLGMFTLLLLILQLSPEGTGTVLMNVLSLLKADEDCCTSPSVCGASPLEPEPSSAAPRWCRASSVSCTARGSPCTTTGCAC